MGLIALKCPNCGATVQMDEDKDYGICEYCGTTVARDRAYYDIHENVSVDGIAYKNSLLGRAFIFMEDGKFEEADSYVERVLDMDPECAKAYMAQLMCRLQVRTMEGLKICDKDLAAFDSFNKAVRFSNGEERKAILGIQAEATKHLNESITALRSDIVSKDSYLRQNREQYHKSRSRESLMKTLQWIMVTLMIIGFIAGFSHPMGWLIGGLVGVAVFFVTRYRTQHKDDGADYLKVNCELQEKNEKMRKLVDMPVTVRDYSVDT